MRASSASIIDDCGSCCRAASDAYFLNFVPGSIVHQKGGQSFKDMAIAKTASGLAYFSDLCKTWNLSVTTSRFDVSLRVRLGSPTGSV